MSNILIHNFTFSEDEERRNQRQKIGERGINQEDWRRGSDSNRRIEVLQTSPLATWVPRHFHPVTRYKKNYGADDGI